MKPHNPRSDWDERTSARVVSIFNNGDMFEKLFERSADAILLFDPAREVFVDCNQAAVEMMRATNKQQLLLVHPAELSPEFQPDGKSSREKTPEVINIALAKGSHRFEWMARRMDGSVFPLEVLLTPIQNGERPLMATVCRDITERKQAERQILELNASLEQRVNERTAALRTSEASLRAVVEHAPEAIVVFDGNTGRFHFGNEHASRLYGVQMEKLTELTPADVSPEFQPGGRRSSDLARELMDQALAGGMPVFEWVHRQQPSGRLISTEVRLLRLPAEGQNLIRASIIDNSERKRAEMALRESEQKYRALFVESSLGIVLHDEQAILEVNPAAVRIMRRHSPAELLGKHPSEMAPRLQSNGETSADMGKRFVEECMAHGSARFDWLASTPEGEEIPLEVILTRIQWSGRQVIQAIINDITERKRAQAALAESEARFSAAFQGSPILIVIGRMSDQKYVLVNDAFVQWSGFAREEILERDSTEFNIWESPSERDEVWVDLRRAGSIRERECHFRNRKGDRTTMLISFEVIQIDHAPHVLAMGLDITARKKAEAELRASEARVRESEARFSAAFRASPVFITISRMEDGRYTLANEAFLDWTGYRLDEVLGRDSRELSLWADPDERERFWQELRRARFIHERECRVRNRQGDIFTMLLSADIIEVAGVPHLLTVGLDITQRKRAEVEMLKALAREKELSQLKSNFVSMVSHEFRTPLGIIQSSAELLREFHEKMQAAEREEQLDSIARNTHRMAGMMEGVLVLGRLDAGKLDFHSATINLKLFCRRIVAEVLSATNRRCVIELTVNSFPDEARADEQLLGHIFTNLLSNAVKYSEPGATVCFSVERDGQDAVCVIRDQGIGISLEDQQQLFKAFNRGSNVGTRPGTGLGLLLVKRCAELHGGRVKVESKVDEGTTVIVRFPVFPKEP